MQRVNFNEAELEILGQKGYIFDQLIGQGATSDVISAKYQSARFKDERVLKVLIDKKDLLSHLIVIVLEKNIFLIIKQTQLMIYNRLFLHIML